MGPKRVHKFGDEIDAVEIQPNPVDTPTVAALDRTTSRCVLRCGT